MNVLMTIAVLVTDNMVTDNGKYYIYRHIRPDTGQPFYIGIGSKPKYYKSYEYEYIRAFCKKGRCVIWHNIVNKNLGNYIIEILCESNDYEFLEKKEDEFIQLYGKIKDKRGGILANINDGGNSSKGRGCLNRYAKAKKVYVYDALTKELVGDYKSTQDAGEDLGIPSSGIRHCTRGTFQTYYGFHFTYLYEGSKIDKFPSTVERKSRKKSTTERVISKMDDNGNVLETQKSVISYQNIYGYNRRTIHYAIKNKIKRNGFYWKIDYNQTN
jgi:hypothetical protein